MTTHQILMKPFFSLMTI